MGETAHKLPDSEWKLWIGGDTRNEGVCLRNAVTFEEITIPWEMLQQIVAGEVRDYRISMLEQMEDEEILGLPPLT